METLKKWVITEVTPQSITLLVNRQHLFTIAVLDHKMMRVLVQKRGKLSLNRTWSVDPHNNLPLEGRDRLKIDDFPCPSFQYEEQEDKLILWTNNLKVQVNTPLTLTWFYRADSNALWQEIAQDRPTGAYCIGKDLYTDIAHYRQAYSHERIYGLGEKSGALERTGKKYEMRNLDAMGYDAKSTDPLYKHLPFLITHHQEISYGLFYDNLSNAQFDLGNEIDNYHPRYRYYKAEAGDLDYYFFVGPQLKAVTHQIVRLTGKTAFLPKWSLGYSGSTMAYTDAPNAQEQLENFLALCQTHQVPCDSFQLSSGYTSIQDKRYVFHWNRDKFPDFPTLAQRYTQNGVRFIANIKPCLLVDHPQYQQLAQEKLFIQNSDDDSPECSVFWDDEGSHLDFTNPKTISWWQKNIIENLLKKGVTATWNDNNEYEVWDRDAKCNGFGQTIPIKLIRPIMPLLMMRASKEAQESFSPNERPYLISRSGCLGMQRYAQTWSGDNYTRWESLKYNIKMGLSMSLSGLYNIGHDVGGFSGPRPDSELFVRWVQNGIMHPRFTIHSWNDDQTANEPWMYPEVLPEIRSAIELRYQLIPYFYTLLWEAHYYDEPIIKPTFLNYEFDPQTFEENDDFLLGDALLVASVVVENARKRTVYLPKEKYGWYEFYDSTWFKGGETVELDAPLQKLPLLVKGGSIIPMTDHIGSYSIDFKESRTFKVFPHPHKGESQGVIFDDDGISHDWQSQQKYLLIKWKLHSNESGIYLYIDQEGKYSPTYSTIDCHLPNNETRPLYINGILQSTIIIE